MGLAEFIARVFDQEAASVGARWQEQAPHVAPRTPDQAGMVSNSESERIVKAVACALRNDPGCHDAVMRAGWDHGAASLTAGLTLHSMLKELDLLTAMMLYTCERAVRDDDASPAAVERILPAGEKATAASPADGIVIARRLHRFFSLLHLAAAKGFTQSYQEGMRQRYKTLRHDLRNPLGTIKSAVSLMEDESVTPEMRNDPRFRQMVSRNARNIESMIGQRLGDAAAMAPAFDRQEVSLREVALAVRRDLRDEAIESECTIDVASDLPTVLTDSIGMELALKSVIACVLRATLPGTSIVIGTGALMPKSAVISVMYVANPASKVLTEHDFEFASQLSERSGGKLWLDSSLGPNGTPQIRLEVPVLLKPGDDLPRTG